MKKVILGLMIALLATGIVAAIEPTKIGQQLVDWINDYIIKPLGRVISSFVTTIGSAITAGIKSVLDAIHRVVTAFVSAPLEAIRKLAEGIKRAIASLFGLGLIAYGARKLDRGNRYIAVLVAGIYLALFPVAVPPIGYAIAGVVFMAIGAAIVGLSARAPPPVSGLISGFGWVIILVGSMIVLYGTFPEYSLYIFAGGALLIFIVGFWTLISYIRR